MPSVLLDTGDCCFMGMPVMMSVGVFPAVGNVLDQTVYGQVNELTGTLLAVSRPVVYSCTIDPSNGDVVMDGYNFDTSAPLVIGGVTYTKTVNTATRIEAHP